jgi:hypothetical protein
MHATAEYKVHGPFPVPVERRRGGRTPEKVALRDFWDHEVGPELASARGCYVFGMKVPRGITPIYVGKATKTFRGECFAPQKLADHYNPALLDYLKGKPMLFLVVQKIKKGKPNLREIGEIEKFLIQVAVAKNPHLSNVHHTKQDRWCIDGVIRAKQGTNSTASGKFKRMMALGPAR